MRPLLRAGLLVLVAGGAVWWLTHRTEDRHEVRPPASPPTTPPAPSPYTSPDKIGRFPRSQFFIEHERFLAADEPQTIPAEEATFLRDDDEVLGFVLGGHPRAYPVTMLSYHHVVNDVLGDVPVAVFY